MESLSTCIRRATQSSRPRSSTRRSAPPLATEFMVHPVISLKPQDSLKTAMDTMVHHGISGAPVTDVAQRVLGIVSELDCMRVIAGSSFHHEPNILGLLVRDVMSPLRASITTDMDLFAVAHLFLDAGVRRLPVLEMRRLVGIVSRRDVLRVIREHYN